MLGDLSAVDRARLTEVESCLADFRTATHSSEVMRQLNELYASEFVARWHFVLDPEGIALGNVAVSDGTVPSNYFRQLEAGVRAGTMSFLFSPRVPEQAQQNRTVLVSSGRWASRLERDKASKLGLSPQVYRKRVDGLERTIDLMDRFGLRERNQMRTLICDGPLLLCYFNVMQPQAFTARQRRIHGVVTEALRTRLLAEHRLAAADGYHATMETAIELLGRAAFLLDARGVVLHANALGDAALVEDPGLISTLEDTIKGGSTDFEATRIKSNGTSIRYLVVRRASDLATLVAAFASANAIGQRAHDVLFGLVTGEGSKSIAARCGMSESTVEYHATRLYRSTKVQSRAELQLQFIELALNQRVK